MEYFCDVRHILSALNHLFFTRLTVSAESCHLPLAKLMEYVLKFSRLAAERFVANQSLGWQPLRSGAGVERVTCHLRETEAKRQRPNHYPFDTEFRRR
jgi:hypothetical protein